MFMASKHFAWTNFAQEQGWDPIRTKAVFPTRDWMEEKRKAETARQAEILQTMLFEHRVWYHKEVLETLRKYPKTADAGLALINMKIQDIAELRKKVENRPGPNAPKHVHEQYAEDLKEYRYLTKPSNLAFLQNAIKTATDAKHRSLLIDKYNVETTEDLARNADAGEGSEKESPDFLIQVTGEPISSQDLTRMMIEMYDKPPEVAANGHQPSAVPDSGDQ